MFGGYKYAAQAKSLVAMVIDQVTKPLSDQNQGLSLTDLAVRTTLLEVYFESLDQIGQKIRQERLSVESARRDILTERHNALREKVTSEVTDLCNQHLKGNDWRTYDSWSHIKRTCAVDFDGLLVRYSDNLDRIEREIHQAETNLSFVITHAKAAQANEQARQARLQAEIKAKQEHFQQLQRLWASDEWSLCPVCTEFMSFEKHNPDQVTCQCQEQQFQDQFECRQQDQILLMRSSLQGKMVAELVAARNNNGFVIKIQTTTEVFLTSADNCDLEYFWQAPTPQEVKQYQETVGYQKAKAEAEKLVRAGDALVIKFSLGENSRGHPQWQSVTRKTIYIADRKAELKPNFGRTTFYCRLSHGLGQQGKQQLILVVPFLEKR
jgi:hypothetical protein